MKYPTRRRGSAGLFVVGLLLVLVAAIILIAQYFSTDFHVKQGLYIPLDRVVNASTVDTAQSNLKEAITYLQRNKLTSGNTSYFIKSAKENDLGYFNENLIKASGELDQALKNEKRTQLEESNLLMRVREVIADNDVIRSPANMGYYPNLYGNLFLQVVGWGIGLIGFLLLMAALHDK